MPALIGLTILLAGCSQVAVMRPVIAVGGMGYILVMLLLVVVVWPLRAVYSWMRRVKANRMITFEPDDDIPAGADAGDSGAPEADGENPMNTDSGNKEPNESNTDRSNLNGIIDLRLLSVMLLLLVTATGIGAAFGKGTPSQVQAVNSSSGSGLGLISEWAHASAAQFAEMRGNITIERVNVSAQVKKLERDSEQSAEVEWEFDLEVRKPGGFSFLPPGSVLLGESIRSRYVKIAGTSAGYTLNFSRKGTYNVTLKSRCRVFEENGRWVLPLALPESMYNRVSLTLPGNDVSHWDDASGGRDVEIFFNRRVLGETTLNIVMSRLQRGVPKQMDLPRLRVSDAVRHTGRMIASAERGVRLRVVSQRGATVRKADMKDLSNGALIVEIVRPEWDVKLDIDVMEPLVRPEILHRVDLSEGMLQHTVFVHYSIENAGVKQFRFRTPAPGITLNVSGRNISRVHPTADDLSEWLVELHGKQEQSYSLAVHYQIPFDPSSEAVEILPLAIVGTAPARGYVAITGVKFIQVIDDEKKQ